MNMFIKNTSGKPSVSLTMVVVAFIVVTLWLAAWVVGVAPCALVVRGRSVFRRGV